MDYEPITKGLRDEMAHGSAGNADVVVLGKTDFEAFCDNIDAIHRSLEAENERLRDASEHGDDWIKLPVDADWVPIQIGDEVEHNGVVANVLGITFHGTTPPMVCICRGDCWVEADELHHHAPTVEDVLCELLDAVDDDRAGQDRIIAEYAAKLRLAGDAE